MQTLACPICRHPVLRIEAKNAKVEARCQNRHCNARPLLVWESDAAGRFLLRHLDRAPERVSTN